MPGGGTQQTQQVNKVDLSPQQQQLIDLSMPNLQKFASSPPQLFPGSLVAGFDPTQTKAQEMALGAAGGPVQDIANTAHRTSDFLQDPKNLYAESNPYLKSSIDAAVRPIEQNLTENVLPNVRSGAVANNSLGGSRQGIAEGLASGRTAQAIGDTSSKMASANYQNTLDTMTKALGLSPQVQQQQLLPTNITSGVGDVRQSLSQALLGEQGQRFNYEQMLPLLQGKELAAIAAGLPGAGSTTTATGPAPNPLLQALGIGAAGSGIAKNLFPGGLPQMASPFSLGSTTALGGSAAGAAGAGGADLASMLPFLLL